MDKKKILVIGSNGQLGSEVQALSAAYPDYAFSFTDVDTIDLTKGQAIEDYIIAHPADVILNCAAYTAVDKAEEDRDTAFLINAVALDYLADAAIACGALLIHVSTDYVFDGSNNTPYTPDEVTFPQSVYGETKYEGEQLLLYSKANVAIIRTSWLYSTYGQNFVKTMLRLGAERDALKVVFDQVGTPTYARDLAKAILDMIPLYNQKEAVRKEVYHYTNEGVASWYDFSKEIFRYRDINCAVEPVFSDAFPTPAKRPKYSVLDKSKIRTEFNLTIPHWVDSLHDMLDKLQAE